MRAVKFTHDQMVAAFWEKVNKLAGPDACWPWMAAKVPAGGYGRFLYKHRLVAAHRVAYLLTYGKLPADLDIMHLCDSPPCCNPKHLKAATTLENMRDSMHKRRHAHGERNSHAKVTEEIVRAMRKIRAETGISYEKLGALYGPSFIAARAICVRKSWKHVE